LREWVYRSRDAAQCRFRGSYPRKEDIREIARRNIVPVLEITYGGQSYRLPGANIDDVQLHIDQIILSGTPGWIEAIDEYGGSEPLRLLITTGVSLALVQLPIH
jgi:hypothetical protein